MAKGVKLSPKYGLNPTIPICFWCGKEKNEIALMGRMGNGRKGQDIEAPRNLLLDYEPCEGCMQCMNQGFTVMEADSVPTFENQPSARTSDDVYPTGRWVVIKMDAARRIFGEWAEASNTELGKAVYVSRMAFNNFVEPPDGQ